MDDFFSKINWQCPECRTPLGGLQGNSQCLKCGHDFKVEDNFADFLVADERVRKDKDDQFRDFFKRWPKFYYFMLYVLGPTFVGLSAKKFVKKFAGDRIILNLGSGPRILSERVINLDIIRYEGVRIVADVLRLPVADASINSVICDTVIEHVAETKQVIDEIHRVLTPGGAAYFTFPLMYPFHASPNDFYRWTKPGFLKLLGNFEIAEAGVRSGIFSALATILCYLFAALLSFGSRKFYWFLVNLSMLLFFPIKLLDFLFFWLPFKSNAAAIMYCVARKR